MHKEACDNREDGALVFHIKHFQEVTSTNDEAGAPSWNHGDVIWADYQTRGRGQRGNRWESAHGANLTFSIVLKPQDFPVENQFYISKIISLALVRALSGFGLQPTVKWPNDIYVGDKKMAGILIENDLLGYHIAKSIIGVGVNINQEIFDPELPNPTSFILSTGQPIDSADILKSILHHFALLYRVVLDEEYDAIDSAYMDSLYRKDGQYRFQEPEGAPFLAAISGVMPTGELVLRREGGQCKSYLFKEVEFVIK